MQDIEAQIIVPVHQLDRPIRRAVESVLASSRAGCVVVAHGLDPHELDLPQDARIRTIALQQGLGCPGAAFNAGLRASTAPLVGVMGSDDWFDPGALDAMVLRVAKTRADGAIAPLRHAASRLNEQNPVTWRRTRLRAARDRLFTRTAPLGLFRRELFVEPRFLFEDDVIAGVDQRNGALLYTSGLNLVHYPGDPAYVVGDDARSRVTTTVRPLHQHAEAWARMWHDERILALRPDDLTALAEKFLRVHLLGMVTARPRTEDWPGNDFEWLSALAQHVLRLAPRADRSLLRAHRRVLDALVANDLPAALAAQSQASYADWRMPARLSGVFRRNFWVRVRIDSALSRLRDQLGSARRRKAPHEPPLEASRS